jgi:hypothetical protein
VLRGRGLTASASSTCGDGLRKALTQMFAPLAMVVAVSHLQLLPSPATTSKASTTLASNPVDVSARLMAAMSSLSLSPSKASSRGQSPRLRGPGAPRPASHGASL